MIQVIKKKGPFDLSFITPEYPYFSQLLAQAISKLEDLPDFSNDEKIAIFSDFSGEHKGASYNTYSFLIMAYDKVEAFSTAVDALRKKHKIKQPYSEFVFKDLKYGPRLGALPEFLNLIDTFIHGAVVTLAIDTNIISVFGIDNKETQEQIVKRLADDGFGNWNRLDAEKVMRICHLIAIFTGITTKNNQRLLWYCDDDSINAEGKRRTFTDTQKIFNGVLGLYCKHRFEILGFAKSFEGKSHLDDLLSIADFAAGVTQDLLHSHKTGEDEIPGADGKIQILKWIARESRYISKITIQIEKLPNGELGSGVVSMSPVN